jgi:hypothetical protein
MEILRKASKLNGWEVNKKISVIRFIQSQNSLLNFKTKNHLAPLWQNIITYDTHQN